MFAISALLTISAAYCGGTWLWLSWKGFSTAPAKPLALERQTFHLGLCFILALGLSA